MEQISPYRFRREMDFEKWIEVELCEAYNNRYEVGESKGHFRILSEVCERLYNEKPNLQEMKIRRQRVEGQTE